MSEQNMTGFGAGVHQHPCVMQGTICVICGTSLAAITAFSVSRGVGKNLAQRVVSEELKSESSEQSAVVESKFKGIQDAIDKGSFAQQSIAVAVLRLTPVVPFRFQHGSFCVVYVQSHLSQSSLA